jgi:hypothetical protein
MDKTYLIITSIAAADHPVLQSFAKQCKENNAGFILIGDSKSPADFNIKDCDFYSVERQKEINRKLSELIPLKHYSRKNLGYLKAINEGAEVIIETDDDNIPMDDFWEPRKAIRQTKKIEQQTWINIYRFFTTEMIWPRGLPLDAIQNKFHAPGLGSEMFFPIQQGLADGNPDVDAIYRLTVPQTDIRFNKDVLSLGIGTWCPFNSQNTTWFKEAFPLLYLPSYCSFRMTDIWRSFVAQRIAWTCGWNILFHSANVYQERNEHNIMKDFEDEISGYTNNRRIAQRLEALELSPDIANIPENLIKCYTELIRMGIVGEKEMEILETWLAEFE